MAGFTSGFAHVGLIKGENHEAALSKLVGIDSWPLFFYTAVRGTNNQGWALLVLINIFGVIKITSEGGIIAIMELDMVELNMVV